MRAELADRALAFRVYAVAALVPALMRLDLRHAARLLEPRRPRPAAERNAVEELLAVVDRVVAGGYPRVRDTCLTRSVTRYYFLRRAGVDVALTFGIADPASGVAAHCWLERDGEPFLERTDPGTLFTPVCTVRSGGLLRAA